jgi:hypothetical protein
MTAWHDNWRSAERLVSFREHAPGDDTRVRDAEVARQGAYEARRRQARRSAGPARPHAAAKRAGTALRIVVAEERNALDRRQRAVERGGRRSVND